MRIAYKWLERATVLYLYSGTLLFVAGWVRPAIAAPFLLAFAYVFYKWSKKGKGEERDPLVMDRAAFFFALLGIAVWLGASGIGGFCRQAGDWDKHNAILHDLMAYSWPVKYSVQSGGDGQQAMLSYYLLFYLFPALAGKVGGFRLAEMALLAQSIAGVFLAYLHLCHFLKLGERRRQIAVFILLVFFGGAVLLGKSLYGHFQPLDLSESFHWFSNGVRIQYSSHIVLMRWVFPQCIAPWLAALLFLESPDRIEDFAWVGAPVFLYSCFAFIGLVPFYIGAALGRLARDGSVAAWIKQALSLQNGYAMLFVMPLFVLYIYGNIFQQKPDVASFHLIDYSGNWMLYLSFCLSNFFIYSLLAWKAERKNLSFYIANGVLFCLPFFWYGAYNDLCMRACIPSFFVIAVLFYQYILNLPFRMKGQLLRASLCICLLCFAAAPQAGELLQNARHFALDGKYRKDGWRTLSGQLIRDGTKDNVAYNYVAYGCEDSFFVKHIARKTEDE